MELSVHEFIRRYLDVMFLDMDRKIPVKDVAEMIKKFSEDAIETQVLISAVGAAHHTARARGFNDRLNDDFAAHRIVCKLKVVD